jgi:pimeloyl-ACP methyl ester carboxylesterase
VAVIGHSRGVHLGKALARRRPELVAHLVGLGGGLSDPMAISAPTGAAVALVRASHRRRGQPECLSDSCRCEFAGAVSGVGAAWSTARTSPLAFNAEAYRAIAAALAKPERQPA